MRLFLLVLITVIASHFAEAQIKYGIKAGYLGSNKVWKPDFENSDQIEGKSSFVAGVWSELILTKNYAVQLELTYSERGVADQQGPSGNVKVSHTYVSMPLLFKIYPTTHAHVEIGVEPSLILGGDTNSQSKVDVAPALGVGYDLWGKVPIGFRYMYGLSPIESITIRDFFGNVLQQGSAKNRSFQFTIGYTF